MDVELAFSGLDATTKTRVERTFAALRQRGITLAFVGENPGF